MHKEILKIALPAIATNITVPLLSLVDMYIAGHMGNVIYISAISVGSTLINLLYWNFGFLRMGTSGLTAQAFGAKDKKEMANLLLRSFIVSLLASMVIFLLKEIIQHFAFSYMKTTSEIERLATVYMNICIIGVPATMCLYSLKGWFIGMQNSIFPMIIAISTNVVNIILSLLLVFHFSLGVVGIATGTVCAEYLGLILAISLWLYKYGEMKKYLEIKVIFDSTKLKRFVSLNSGIAIRSFCLTSTTCFFTLAGAKQGPLIVAVNTLLMQLFTLFSYFTDGFAYAGEALVGKYIGAKDITNMKNSITFLFRWGWILVFIFSICYLWGTDKFLCLFTDDLNVISAAKEYHYWVVAIPICGFSAFLWDGIMVGATMAKGMVVSIVMATVCFFILYNILFPYLANHSLWIAFLSYLALRGLGQFFYFKTIGVQQK